MSDDAAAPASAPLRPPSAPHSAHDSLIAFARTIEVPGVGIPGPDDPPLLADHHLLWLKQLEAVESGRIRRLMGFMPPGSAKSTYAVDVFTPWFMGRAPGRNVIVATYASALARRRGRKARSVARQPVFREIFGTGPAAGAAAADAWALDNGSDWMGAGILAGITGNRADLIVIDDPVKGRDQADSPVIRERTREEFDDTLRTRLKAGGRIVLIQTRWHEDDLAGGLLPPDYQGQSGPVLCRDGQVWDVVNLPARAERADDPLGRPPGAWLWPEYWPADHWAQFQVNPRTWSALYQQRPRPTEGSFFPRGDFRRFNEAELPRLLTYYGTSDYAVTEGRGDYTRLIVWGLDRSRRLWRVAAWGGRTSSNVWIGAQLSLMARFRPLGGIRRWFGEAGVIQKAIEPMLQEGMAAQGLNVPLFWLPSLQDKTARALAAQNLVMSHRVWVRDDPDGDDFIDECVAFPAGRHDDAVDALSLMGRALDMLSKPSGGQGPGYADSGFVLG